MFVPSHLSPRYHLWWKQDGPQDDFTGSSALALGRVSSSFPPKRGTCLSCLERETTLNQGSPTPGPLPVHGLLGTGPWPVRNRAAQQEVSSRQASEASSAALPITRITAWTIARITTWTIPSPSIPPPPIHGKTDFHETGPWCQKGWGPLL